MISIMKILLAHNHYLSAAPSGETTVFLSEKELLEDSMTTLMSHP